MLILILGLTLSVSGQSFFQQEDKQKHMKVSAALTAVGFTLFPDNKLEVVASVLVIGFTKEMFIDKLRKNGNPSFEDMGANLIGVGSVVTIYVGFDQIKNRKEKRKKKKKVKNHYL